MYVKLRVEMYVIRDELQSEMHEIRDELRTEMHGIRDELRVEMHGIGDELKQQINESEAQTSGQLAILKGDMRDTWRQVLYQQGETTKRLQQLEDRFATLPCVVEQRCASVAK